jgi:hypothetical protein
MRDDALVEAIARLVRLGLEGHLQQFEAGRHPPPEA